MDIDAAAEFAAVPATARLEQCEPTSDLYQAATALYERYRLVQGSNIGQAKRSKLLHLKRPWQVPIADTRVMSVYRRRADSWAARLGISSGYWEAVREDLNAGRDDFEWLTATLSDLKRDRPLLILIHGWWATCMNYSRINQTIRAKVLTLLQQIAYFEKHREEIMDRFPGQIVVIRHEDVAFAGTEDEAFEWVSQNRWSIPVYIVNLQRPDEVGVGAKQLSATSA